MNKARFNVLASIYRLLSEADAEMLLDASRHANVSENIRDALASLAREASQRGGVVSIFQRRKARSQQAERPSLRARGDEIRMQLLAYLNNPRRFPDKVTLAVFARDMGAEFRVNPKWGRPRTVSAVTRAIMERPAAIERFRSQITSMSDPETSGWIDVIRRSN